MMLGAISKSVIMTEKRMCVCVCVLYLSLGGEEEQKEKDRADGGTG